MKAIPFAQANTILKAPEQSQDSIDAIGKIEDLHVHFNRREGHMMSIWKPTEKDLEILNNGGAVALFVYGGQHPPVSVTVADLSNENEADVTSENETEVIESSSIESGKIIVV